MDAKIDLSEEVWSEFENVFVRGHAFYEGEYIDSTEIGKVVQERDGIEGLSPCLGKFNGFYSIVIDCDDKTIVATDRMRTGPVFYSTSNDNFLISDDCGWVLEEVSEKTRSEISEIEYKRSRFVTGPYTLYSEISQLQSGEVVEFDKSTGEVRHYHHHVHTTSDEEYDNEEIKQKFKTILERAFDRLTQAADGRQIVVPLSGGYDSRLIALMLKKTGYENVLTYSDKSSGSGDADLAKGVADNLDLPWKTVELTHSDWRSFYESNKWDNYFESASYLGSLPQPTHVLTLEKLLDRGEISQDAIVVPGHSALDTMKATPEKLESQDSFSVEELTEYIVSQHFKYNTHIEAPIEELSKRVRRTVRQNSPDSPKSAVEAFERWRLKERRSKLIVNSNRSFDFVGLDWWMPLEDEELYEFWRKVPMDKKRHRSFYESYIRELYMRVGGVDYDEANEIADDNLKTKIADIVRGTPIWTTVKSCYNAWDKSWVKYQYINIFELDRIYKNDSRLGIISKRRLNEMYRGQSYLFYSILAQLTVEEAPFNQ